MRLSKKPEFIPPALEAPCRDIIESVGKAGGKALLVGGCVRDALLGKPVTDMDIEVFALPASRLETILKRQFSLDYVGKAFGVFKVRGFPIDISLPRKEVKTGLGHKGFAIEGNPELSFEEAAARRDFTVNAISWDPLRKTIVDPFKGRADLEEGTLRHTSEQFSEDPLRVFRAMQLSSRFLFHVHPATIQLCKNIGSENLPPERIFEEWKKLITKGLKPSLGLAFLENCGWVSHFPELEALSGCAQDPDWHPEGDVWTHTLHCMDAFAAERTGEPWEDLVVGFAVLCHDFGKPATTIFEKGRVRSPRHEIEGEGPTRLFLERMTRHRELIDSIIPLVLTHLRPLELFKARAGDSAVRRLARKVRRIDRLVRVARADMQGRPPLKGGDFPAGEWLLQRAEALAVKDSAPKPIVMGRHLLAMDQKPGPSFKAILEKCYEAQLDGDFKTLEEGKLFLQRLLHE